MTLDEKSKILKSALDRAKSSGFVMEKHKHFLEIGRDPVFGTLESLGAYGSILFDPAFARAFFGEKEYGNKEVPVPARRQSTVHTPEFDVPAHILRPRYVKNRGWQYHLQQMVLDPEPLAYLEKFL